MASLPRPLLAVLVVVAAAFAAWMTVIAPKSSSSASSPPPAVHVPAPSVAHATAHTKATQPVSKHATAVKPRPAHAKAATAPKATPQSRLATLDAALKADKVVALLFYNPSGSDDGADVKVLSAIPAHGGRVVKLAVPINELSRYGVVTQQVAITGSPTLVVIDSQHRAQTLVGFADQLEYDQLVAGALAKK
jgi:hypothetical protein